MPWQLHMAFPFLCFILRLRMVAIVHFASVYSIASKIIYTHGAREKERVHNIRLKLDALFSRSFFFAKFVTIKSTDTHTNARAHENDSMFHLFHSLCFFLYFCLFLHSNSGHSLPFVVSLSYTIFEDQMKN